MRFERAVNAIATWPPGSNGTGTHSPRLAELYSDGYRALTEAIAGALRRAATSGQADAGLEPVRAARQAVALADGLGWHLLCAPEALTADDAIAALDVHLAALLPPAPAGHEAP